MNCVVTTPGIFRYEIGGAQRDFHRVFHRGAAVQALRDGAILIVHVSEARDCALLMRPVQDRIRVLLPDLVGLGETQGHQVSAQRLVAYWV